MSRGAGLGVLPGGLVELLIVDGETIVSDGVAIVAFLVVVDIDEEKAADGRRLLLRL